MLTSCPLSLSLSLSLSLILSLSYTHTLSLSFPSLSYTHPLTHSHTHPHTHTHIRQVSRRSTTGSISSSHDSESISERNGLLERPSVPAPTLKLPKPVVLPHHDDMKRMCLADFNMLKVLGKGSFGKVCTYIYTVPRSECEYYDVVPNVCIVLSVCNVCNLCNVCMYVCMYVCM